MAEAADRVGERRVACDGHDVVVAIARATSQAGHIGLEADGGRIELRGVRVRRLDTYLQPLPPRGGELRYVDKADFKAKTAMLPTIVKEVKPSYSMEAMRQRSIGMVLLEAIVLADGTVGPVRVVKSLDLDLDQESVATIRQWLFTPAQKDGRPVPALVEIEMSFRLK